MNIAAIWLAESVQEKSRPRMNDALSLCEAVSRVFRTLLKLSCWCQT